MTEAKYIAAKARIVWTDSEGKDHVMGKDIPLGTPMTPSDKARIEFCKGSFTMSGTITPSPEWETFMQTIRARAFYQWLNAQPKMRGLMMSASFHAMLATGVLS